MPTSARSPAPPVRRAANQLRSTFPNATAVCGAARATSPPPRCAEQRGECFPRDTGQRAVEGHDRRAHADWRTFRPHRPVRNRAGHRLPVEAAAFAFHEQSEIGRGRDLGNGVLPRLAGLRLDDLAELRSFDRSRAAARPRISPRRGGGMRPHASAAAVDTSIALATSAAEPRATVATTRRRWANASRMWRRSPTPLRRRRSNAGCVVDTRSDSPATAERYGQAWTSPLPRLKRVQAMVGEHFSVAAACRNIGEPNRPELGPNLCPGERRADHDPLAESHVVVVERDDDWKAPERRAATTRRRSD